MTAVSAVWTVSTRASHPRETPADSQALKSKAVPTASRARSRSNPARSDSS